MDPESGATRSNLRSILRHTERPPTGRRRNRTTPPGASRGITKPSRRNTRSNHTRPASPQQTTFRIRRRVLFEAQLDNCYAKSDARAPSPISRARPQTSSDQSPAPVSMHARGTKRSAEADEFELRLEVAPGNDARINEKGGMIGTAKVIDTMAGLFAYGRTKLQSWLGNPTPHRDDAGDASPKRVKLSDDAHSEASDSGSVRWKSRSVIGGATPRLQERKWPADSSRPHKPSTAEKQTRPLATEDAPPPVGSFTSTSPLSGSYPGDGSLNNALTIPTTRSTNGERGLGSPPVSSRTTQPSTPRHPFTNSSPIAGSYPVDGSLDIASTIPATPSANGERDLGSPPGSSRTTRPFTPRHSTSLVDPHSKSRLFRLATRPRGGTKSLLSPNSLARSRSTNDWPQTRLPLDSSPEPASKDGASGEKDSRRDDETNDKEAAPAPPTRLVFDESEEILGTFNKLKISGVVARREEERERKNREREEEKRREEEDLRRQAEEQRLREEAKKRGGLRQPLKDLFPALTADWTAQVQSSLRPGDKVLAETLEAKLKSHDFQRLVPATVWLNDNIVNGTLLWLDRFINQAAGVTDVKTQTRKCLMPGSFFFTRLLDNGVKNTERSLRRLGVNKGNILDIETILMPICQGSHWTLVVVEPRKRRISHFDSLNPAGSEAKRTVARDWMRSVLGDAFVEEEWRNVKYRAPQQFNSFDCGVHTVLNGVCLGLGIEPSAAYSSDQLPDLRMRIAAMLLNGGFKEEFSLEGC